MRNKKNEMQSITFPSLLLFISGSLCGQTPDSWTQRSDFGGSDRYGAVGFSIGNYGYIGTGYTAFGCVKDFWEYDPVLDSWTQKADFGGVARFDAVGFSIDDNGYIGAGDWGGGFLKDFWQFDSQLNIWIQQADFEGVARTGAVGFSIGSKGYIGTGNDLSNYLKDFWEYDPALNNWTQRADLPFRRTGAAGFTIGEKGYIGTGYKGENFQKTFAEYDPAIGTWTSKPVFPGNGRVKAVGFSIGNFGYIGTGYGYDSIYSLTQLNDIWAYDPASATWLKKSDVGGGVRSSAVGFIIAGKGYIGTGITTDDTPTSDFWEYTPGFGIGISSIISYDEIFSLFPNPANDEFVVSLQLINDLNAEAKIKVINLLGLVVYNKTSALLKGKLQSAIKLNDVTTNGIYLVRVIVNDQVYCGQIVFER